MKWKSIGFLLGLAAIGHTLGCDSGPKYVPVSGVITLDGKPYGDAVITFQPMLTSTNPNPGRGSSAETDSDGRFVLKTDEAKDGAVVGMHKVRIMTKGTHVLDNFDPEKGSPDGVLSAPAQRAKPDPIPVEWRDKEFEVPAGGTDKADFHITTKR
jgi:hypothetical protein